MASCRPQAFLVQGNRQAQGAGRCRDAGCGERHADAAADRELDALRETSDTATAIGTTWCGIGPAYDDKVGRRAIRRWTSPISTRRRTRSTGCWRTTMHCGAASSRRQGYPARADRVRAETVCRTPRRYGGCSISNGAEGKRILFEGAQGALVADEGTYPYVTSSSTVAAQVATGTAGPRAASATCSASGRPPRSPGVGEGPFPTGRTKESGRSGRRARIRRHTGAQAARRLVRRDGPGVPSAPAD